MISYIISILSGMGIGGGGLLVIFLTMNGMDQIEAQGINLIYFLFSSGAAMLVHLIKRKLNFKLIAYLAAFGLLGAILGSVFVQNAEPEAVKKCFGILLLISGAMSFVHK